MNFVSELLLLFYNPKKTKQVKKCMLRFDDAYRDVNELLPETSLSRLLHQIAVKQENERA